MAKEDNKSNNAIGCLAALIIAVIVVIVVLIANLFGGNDEDEKKKDEVKNDKVTVSKNASPKEKLAANIKNNIGKEHFKSITLNEDKIIIYLKNYDGVTDKGQIKSMDNGIVKSLMQLKKTDIKVNDIEVTVMQEVQTKKLKDAEAVKLRTTWDPETVANLNDDNESEVFNNARDYAEEYSLNKNIK
ncbi:hypothetical protein [Staphylococcus xylosus]|uniref:hypothetical protein n=1 Tax=Staphylococcus xylosus TaxID=1288 RepID=UPI003F5588D5